MTTHFPNCALVCVCLLVSYSLLSHGLWPSSLLCPWNFPGKNTKVGCLFLLQRIFLTNDWTHLYYITCTGRQILYHCATWEALNSQYQVENFKEALFRFHKFCLLFLRLVSVIYFYWTRFSIEDYLNAIHA